MSTNTLSLLPTIGLPESEFFFIASLEVFEPSRPERCGRCEENRMPRILARTATHVCEQNGMSLQKLAVLLSPSNIKMTMVYAHLVRRTWSRRRWPGQA